MPGLLERNNLFNYSEFIKCRLDSSLVLGPRVELDLLPYQPTNQPTYAYSV